MNTQYIAFSKTSFMALKARLATPFLRGLGMMGGAQVAMRISRLAATILLARLLTPDDFGLAAIILTVYELVSLFTRNGIASMVVQASDADVGRVAETAYWMTWIVCLGLVLVQAAIALPFAWVYGNATLALPIALMGLIHLATPLCNIQCVMMEREGRFGRIALGSCLQVVADNLLTAVFAVMGLGMWAIVLPKILVAPIWVIVTRTGHGWRPIGTWAPKGSLEGWRDIARFAQNVVGVEVLTTVQANADNLIVGYVLGVEALGVYYFAFNAGLGITLGLVNAFRSAVYPHLCQARSDRAMLSARYRQTSRTLGLIVVPLVLTQVALAPVYVPIVFGQKWTNAVPVLMIICLSAVVRPFATTCSQLLKAVGRPDIDLHWQAILTPILLIALAFGTLGGIIGVAIAVCAVQTIVLTAFCIRAPRAFVGPSPVATNETGDFEIVTDLQRLLTLREAWDDLWRRAHEPRFTQSFTWCVTGLRTVGRRRGRRPHIVVMKEAGRVVLIWPMTTGNRLFWRTGTCMGSESTEYDAVLVEDGPQASERIATAWRFIRAQSGIDLITVPFVRLDKLVHRVLTHEAGHATTHTLSAPYVSFRGESWDGYWRSRGATRRNGLTRRRRRLAEQGRVTMDLIETGVEMETMIDWALRNKIDWMKRRGLANDFMATPGYRDFLVSLAGQHGTGGRLAVFALSLNGSPIAAKIVTIDGTRCEGFITVYDERFAAFSPGQIILVDCLKWCHEQGMDYDFRIGDEGYKLDWATSDCPTTTWRIANTPAGRILLARAAFVETCGQRINAFRAMVPAG